MPISLDKLKFATSLRLYRCRGTDCQPYTWGTWVNPRPWDKRISNIYWNKFRHNDTRLCKSWWSSWRKKRTKNILTKFQNKKKLYSYKFKVRTFSLINNIIFFKIYFIVSSLFLNLVTWKLRSRRRPSTCWVIGIAIKRFGRVKFRLRFLKRWLKLCTFITIIQKIIRVWYFYSSLIKILSFILEIWEARWIWKILVILTSTRIWRYTTHMIRVCLLL